MQDSSNSETNYQINTSSLYEQYKFTDVTDDFISSCKELNDSIYAMSAGFRLVDAMSAIELMDPKMDTGMKFIEKKLDIFPLQIEKFDALRYNDLIATFDASFAMLASWLNAQPLDQTIFTNLCLLTPDLLKDLPHLHAISTSFLHLVNLFKLFIESASVFNEEDISLVFAHQITRFTNEHVENTLKSCMDTLHTEMTNKGKTDVIGNGPLEAEALYRRFELFLNLFDLFNNLLLSPKLLISQNNSILQTFSPDLKKSANCIQKCIQLLKKIISTIHLGIQPIDFSDDGNFTWLPMFDSNAYLYLSPTGFPRKPKLFSRQDSYKYFEHLLETILHVTRSINECTGSTSDIMDFLRRFGDENSSVLTRSILQLIFLPHDHIILGMTPLDDIILNSMNRFSGMMDGAGVEEMLKIALSVEPSMHILLDEFISILVRAYMGVFQTFGNNLARQREKLLRTNFEDFGILMTEANRVEAELEVIRLKYPDNIKQPQIMGSFHNIFTNYLLYTILEMMRYHFELGFRLRLFLPYEFTYVYWYFGEIIAKYLTNLSERICNSLIMEFSKNSIHNQKKISGKKLQQKTRLDNDFRKKLGRMKMNAIFYRIETIMANAMFKFSLGLIGSKKLAQPKRESARYVKRIEPFVNLPAMLCYSYDEYLRESNVTELCGRPYQENFIEAAHLFGQTISMCNDIDMEQEEPERNTYAATLSGLQRLAKQNLIVAKLLATQQINKKISFEFNSAEKLNFPLIRFL